MKKLLVFSFIISSISFYGCNDDDDALCLKGGGSVMEYDLELAAFDRISLSGPVNLLINQGEEQKVVIKAEPELFEPLQYGVSGSLFEIGYNNVRCFETNFGVLVEVTIPDLKSVAVSGVSEIRSEGPLEFSTLEFDVAGVGDISITGNINEMEYDNSGTIVVRNFELESQNTSLSVSGTGDFEITCTETLDITVSGSAEIKYKGNPSITQNVSGALTLTDSN